jgi:hypothetical protein
MFPKETAVQLDALRKGVVPVRAAGRPGVAVAVADVASDEEDLIGRLELE